MSVPADLRRRWAAIALVASLVLNAFLLGMVAVDWLKPRRGFSGERFAGFELRRLDDRLSKDAVTILQDQLAPLGPQLDARVERLRSLREEIMQLAAVAEPDRAAIDERLTALRAETAAMQEEVQRSTYGALLALPPEMRASLAEKPS
jgi:hypothetical protein